MNCKACGCAGAVVSAVFAAAIGVLFAFGFLPFISAAAWAIFGFSAAALLILFISALTQRRSGPVCSYGSIVCLLTSAVASIILSLALVTVELLTASAWYILLAAVAAFAFLFLLINIAGFIVCSVFRSA